MSELPLEEGHTIDELMSHPHSVLLQGLCSPSSVTVVVVSSAPQVAEGFNQLSTVGDELSWLFRK